VIVSGRMVASASGVALSKNLSALRLRDGSKLGSTALGGKSIICGYSVDKNLWQYGYL